MTSEERYAAFVAAIENAMHAYGYQIAAQVQVEVQGAIVISRGISKIEPIPNWQPKPELEQSAGADTETIEAPARNGRAIKVKDQS